MGFLGKLFGASPTPVGIHGAAGLPVLAERVQGIMENRIAILEESPSYPALRAAYLTIKAHAAAQAAVAPAGKRWSQALWWGAMSAEALLQCAHPSPTELYFHRAITVPPADAPAPALASVWREGFEMAVLAGYDEVASSLLRFNVDRLRGYDPTNEAELLYAHALQGVFSEAADLGDRLQNAIERIAQPDSNAFVLRLLGGELECLYAVVIGDRAMLHKSLTSGLEQHHKYWTNLDRATEAEGLFSLGMSFIAHVARQRGHAIDVRSPYLVHPHN